MYFNTYQLKLMLHINLITLKKFYKLLEVKIKGNLIFK